MILLKFGTLEIGYPLLSKYKVIYQKIDGSGTKRNLQGTMRRQVIANKIKIVADTVDELEERLIKPILTFITKDTMTIDYYDIKTSTFKTIRCYANVPELEITRKENNKIYYSSFKLELIEL